jgi:hypothetical protein
VGERVLVAVEEVELGLVETFVVTFITAVAAWFVLVALQGLFVRIE